MKTEEYQKIVKRNLPKENKVRNMIIAFVIGGLIGVFAQGLSDLYVYMFKIEMKEALTYSTVTLVFLGCLCTCLGFFDKFVHFARAGLIVPITGFAHSMMSATLEYKKDGMITGIGANMIKLAGSVIVYGVVSSYVFGLLRYLIFGG